MMPRPLLGAGRGERAWPPAAPRLGRVAWYWTTQRGVRRARAGRHAGI
jgi:hypothetical protein